MSLFGEIEKTIERGFRRWTERVLGPAESGELVIVHRAILEEIEGKVQVVSRGRRIFPFSRILVTLVAQDEERRAMLQGAFGERLGSDVRDLLEGGGCEFPRAFTLEVRTAAAGSGAFEIEYGAEAIKPAPAKPLEPGRLILVKGKTDRSRYDLDRARINLGRLAELTDSDHRVVRR